MFSYATDTLTQTIGLQQALGGTGIQVHGYNYGWEFRYISNNTTENDTLLFNISLRNSSGTVVESQNLSWDGAMQMNIFQYDTWYTVSNSRTFDNPYTDPQSISLTITGRDGGFWAGYYGPEVRNVSLSVNYSFDPCAADPLYSSSCPGYAEAYTAYLFEMLGWSITPEPESEVAAIDYSLTPSTSSSMSVPEETATGEVKVDAGGIEVSTTGELQVPDGIPEEAREKKPVDMNLISRIVREATDDSAALSVVNRSIESSMAEDANPDFSMTAETLAAIARQTENSVQQSILENIDVNAQQNDRSQQQIQDAQTGMPDTTEVAQPAITFSAATVPVESAVAIPTVNLGTDTTTEDATARSDTLASELANTSRVEVRAEPVREVNNTVKRQVQNNEAAGDRGIEDIATEPQDFGMYLARQLADVQFYQTEAIYRDLEPVDNRRSLRMLSGANDRLHQEMVNDQYQRR
jgi:hypothetical protein